MTSTCADPALAKATLFRCHQPLRRHLDALERIGGRPVEPVVTLAPLDAFLLHEGASFFPIAPAVIDLAGDATLGASTVCWSLHPNVRCVITVGQPQALWADALGETLTATGEGTRPKIATVDATGAECLSHVGARLPPGVPILVTIPGVEPFSVRALLERWSAAHPQAVFFILPIGPLGGCAVLDALLDFCSRRESYRLTALRELSPFLASSRLALIQPRAHTTISVVLERLRGLFEGNFQFLDLAARLTENALQLKQAARLAEEIAERDRQLRVLAGELAREKDHAARALQESHQDKERLVEGLIARNLEKERVVQALAAQKQQQDQRLRLLERQVQALTNGPTARPHPLRRFAAQLAPQGTRRRRAARVCLGMATRTVARLRAVLTGL